MKHTTTQMKIENHKVCLPFKELIGLLNEAPFGRTAVMTMRSEITRNRYAKVSFR